MNNTQIAELSIIDKSRSHKKTVTEKTATALLLIFNIERCVGWLKFELLLL